MCALALHEDDDIVHQHAKNYCTGFLGDPYHSNRDATRARLETGNLNAVLAFGDEALPRHGHNRWHLHDPICFTEDLTVSLQQIGNDDVELFERQDDVASVAYWYSIEAKGNEKRSFSKRDRLPR